MRAARAMSLVTVMPGSSRMPDNFGLACVAAMFAALFLLAVVVVYRILSGFLGSDDYTWLHNFAPVAAVALCGAVYLPRRIAELLPIVMLFVSELVLNLFHYHQPF